MLQKTNKLLIGKDIDRTAAAAAATTFHTLIGNATLNSIPLADGEVIVLDRNKVPLAAGSTVADSDTIFICQGTSVTGSWTNPAGTIIYSRRVNISDAIRGDMVRKYTGTSYQAKAEQAITHALTGTVTAGTEYLVRIVYKDMVEHPGQFTQTYRVIANSTATTTALATQFAAKINAHGGRRINATTSTNTLILTAREIPEACTALSDINEFSMVEFDSFVDYIIPTGTTNAGTLTAYANTKTIDGTGSSVRCEYGSGNWEQIRDLEKSVLGNRGVYNVTSFPVIKPVQDTVVDAYYDLIIIEHDRDYLSPDNQYRKQAPCQTTIALATASTGINAKNQASQILAVLNPWMASAHEALPGITI